MQKYYLAPNITDLATKDQQKTVSLLKPKLLKGAKLATRHYEPQAYTYLSQHKLVNKVVNMYDYFTDNVNVPTKDLHIRLSGEFPLNDFNIIGLNNNRSDIYYQGHLTAHVDIAPLTVQLIGTVTYVDDDDVPTSKDLYDRRGFLSSTQYFDQEGNLGHQIIYSHTGQPKIEIIVMRDHSDNNIKTTGIKLLDYKGADYLFLNEDNLWDFFVSELKGEE